MFAIMVLLEDGYKHYFTTVPYLWSRRRCYWSMFQDEIQQEIILDTILMLHSSSGLGGDRGGCLKKFQICKM